MPIAIVALVALVAAIAGIGNEFARDDLPIVVGDPRLHDLGHISEILTQPYWPPPAHPDLYRPSPRCCSRCSTRSARDRRSVFRLVSIALYVAASIGVLQLAKRILAPRVALGVALLFAAHPVHVEAVAQAVNQGELIVAVIACFMTVKLIDGRAHRASHQGLADARRALLRRGAREGYGIRHSGTVIGRRRPLAARRRSSRPKGWWFGYAMLVAPGVLAFVLRTSIVGSASGSFVADALVNLGIGGRTLTMLGVVPEWLRLLVWPAHLRVDYSPGEFVAATTFGAATSARCCRS